jgi:hypothetical protein
MVYGRPRGKTAAFRQLQHIFTRKIVHARYKTSEFQYFNMGNFGRQAGFHPIIPYLETTTHQNYEIITSSQVTTP